MTIQNRMILFWVTAICCLMLLGGCGKTTTVRLVEIERAPSFASDTDVTEPNSAPELENAVPSETNPTLGQAEARATEAVNGNGSEPSAGEEGAHSAPSEASEPVTTEEAPAPLVRSYILNSSSKKIHYPNCSAVKKMAEKNKQAYTGTVAELKAMGYSPCGICRPS